jgi:hypothetical protein
VNGYYNIHCFPLTSSTPIACINKHIFMHSFSNTKFQSSYKLCGIIFSLCEHNVVATATFIIPKWIGIWSLPCEVCLLLFAMTSSSIWGFGGVVNYGNRNFVKEHDLEKTIIYGFDPSQLCIRITRVIPYSQHIYWSFKFMDGYSIIRISFRRFFHKVCNNNNILMVIV